MKKQLEINKIKSNSKNPRLIKNKKFKILVNSIQRNPTFMKLRPIIIDEDFKIIGGNMRHKVCLHLRKRRVWTDMFTKEMANENNIEAEKNGNPIKSYQEYCDEIMIKDNSHNGDWDYDILGNEWDSALLKEYGVDVWQDPKEIEEIIEKENKLNDINNTILIKFNKEDFPEAEKLVNYWEKKDVYFGGMILEFLKNKKHE
jgi:hypothetical protein